LPIDEHSAENPWHIWIDVISKFRLLLKQYDRPLKDYVFVLSNESGYFNRVVKELLPEIKYYVMPKNSTWRFKELIVPSMSNHHDGIIVPPLADWLRETFGMSVSNPHRKIFVSRQDALTRKLTNAGEVFVALKGWEIVTLSAMSIRDQIRTFASASDIITTHGAGLTNLLWCQKGTKIFEIGLPEQISKKVYPILSHCLQLKHTLLLGKKISLSSGKIKPAGVKRLNDYADIEMNIKGDDLTELTLGFLIDAQIKTATAENVLVLPAEAMKRELGEYFVFVVDEENTRVIVYFLKKPTSVFLLNALFPKMYVNESFNKLKSKTISPTLLILL
jgi:hypothetical protein